MANRQILITLLLLLCLPMAACTEDKADTSPTAIIIDDATGQPVEGAVALAQWFSAGGGGLFEGGVDNLDKAAEAFSDKDGKVYIKDFWTKHMFSKTPRLTVYKPGYVLWDSRRICPSDEPRFDFDEKERTIKLLKFDTESPKWVEKYPQEGGPRRQHNSFFYGCYSGAIGIKYQRQFKFRDIFLDYETPLFEKEKMERGHKLKAK